MNKTINSTANMFFFPKNNNKVYLVCENSDGSLLVSLNGVDPIPNAGLFIKNAGGIDALKSKCVTDTRSLQEIREELDSKRKQARAKAAERASDKAEQERINAEKALNQLLEQHGGVIETNIDNLRVVARYLSTNNHGAWHLPKMNIGYSANQYENGAVTIKLDEPICVDDRMITDFAFGAKSGELKNYYHCRF